MLYDSETYPHAKCFTTMPNFHGKEFNNSAVCNDSFLWVVKPSSNSREGRPQNKGLWVTKKSVQDSKEWTWWPERKQTRRKNIGKVGKRKGEAYW